MLKQFSTFSLDSANQCVLRGEGQQSIQLAPKAYGVFSYLVEHAERLVSKEELLDAVVHAGFPPGPPRSGGRTQGLRDPVRTTPRSESNKTPRRLARGWHGDGRRSSAGKRILPCSCQERGGRILLRNRHRGSHSHRGPDMSLEAANCPVLDRNSLTSGSFTEYSERSFSID